MKAVQTQNWQDTNLSTQQNDVDQACQIIAEIDAVWRMSAGLYPNGDSFMSDEEYIFVASRSTPKAA